MKLLEILGDPAKCQIELSITADVGEPFVKSTYQLEGIGPLVVAAFEEIAALRATISAAYYLNTNAVARKSSSNPGQWVSCTGSVLPEPNPMTDKYVIVTRQDFNHSTQPRDIPVPLPQAGTTKISQAIDPLSTSVDPLQDKYEVMNAVKRQIHLDRIAGSGPKFQMVPPVPAKKGMANHGNSTSQLEANRRQSMRDSMDLDSVESGSRVSVASARRGRGSTEPHGNKHELPTSDCS